MKQPKVSIVILNFNGINDTIKCFESLKNINYHNFDIVLVDNHSEGDDIQILQQYSSTIFNITFIKCYKNHGYAKGNNIGVDYALKGNPKYILLTNNDVIFDKEFLNELVKVAESNTEFSTLSPIDENILDNTKYVKMGIEPNLWTWKYKEMKIPLDKCVVECYHNEFCMLIRASIIRKIGLYDNRLFFGADGYEWYYKNYKKGYKIVCCPKARVWHNSSATVSKYPEKWMYYSIRGQLLIEKKYGSYLQFSYFLFHYIVFKFLFTTKVIMNGKYDSLGKSKKFLIKEHIKGIIDGVLINE